MPRPVPTFHDFVGHKKVVDLLRRQLAGSQAHRRPFPHTLFTGASGLGKTLLARALAAEYGATLVTAMGDIAMTDLVNKLMALNTTDFLFIDEAHLLKSAAQQLLYEAIDQCRVPRIPGSVAASAPREENETTATIRPCTIILATDQPGSLKNALQKRMALRVPLGYYPIDELREISYRMATDMNLLLSPQAARLIAKVSAGLPRRVRHHLQNLQNHFPDSDDHQLSVPQVREFLAAFDIDDKGLGVQERQYLSYLHAAGSASVETLALYLGLDCEFVRHQIEPLLLRERFLKIGSGGRQLTHVGEAWITKSTADQHLKGN
jgi:holliday junction DNA helicase RuvB